jgi:macrolide transport system ATP-binding/permease protein
MTSFFRKLGWLKRRRIKEDELRAELQFHVDEEASDRQAQGFTREEAERAARRDLGNVAIVQEDTRAAWGWTWLEQFLQDVRYATRTMRANKLFTVLAVISLALGIGANTAIYSFLDAVLLRPLPVEDPDSLVVLTWKAPIPAQRRNGIPVAVISSMSGSTYRDPDSILTSSSLPYPAFELFRTYDSVFSSVFAYYRTERLHASVLGHGEILDGVYVSGEYFRGLGVSPIAGRPIVPDDDRPGGPGVAVISHAYSEARFERVSDAIGQPIVLNNAPFTIVGVAPRGFFGADSSLDPEVFIPLRSQALLSEQPERVSGAYLNGNYYWLQIMGRLRPDMTLERAQAALAPAFSQWVETTASSDLDRAELPRLAVTEGAAGQDAMRRRYSRQLYVLMTLVGLILATACANIANLLLARSAARRREIAFRLSLGAGRFRIVRQLLTESVVLASLGGIVGIFVGVWGIRFLTLLLGMNSGRVLPRAELSWQVVAVAVGLSLGTGLLFGLIPALRATRRDVISALKEVRSRRTPSRIPVSFSEVLVVSQVIMSLLMLVAAGLFVRTLANLQSVDIGFDRENLLLFEVSPGQAGYRDAEMLSFYDELHRRFRGIPGATDISFSHAPLLTAGFSHGMTVDGQRVDSNFLYVGPRFFSTMGIPMLLGREIDEREQPGSPLVAVVSELFAKTNFPGESPLGKRIAVRVSQPGPAVFREMEIVGVAKDARYGGVKEDLPQVVYASHSHAAPLTLVNRMTFELRTTGDPLALVNTVRGIVRDVNPIVPVVNITSQTAQIEATLSQEIMFARVCTAFAILALTIACVGLYGTVAYNVASRTSEIGIRLALGAQRSNVIRMVLQRVMLSVLAALALGLPLALMASQYVETFLFAIKPRDPLAISAAVAILLLAAALAAFVPAHRASRVDPLVALRHE